MKKNKNLSEKEINEIIKLYTTETISKEKLALQFKVGKLKINKVLSDNGINSNKKGNQRKNKSVADKPYMVLKPSEGKMFVAICKKTGKTFKDPLNTSGTLTIHLLNEIDRSIKPPKDHYWRKRYYENNNKYWFEEWFSIIEVDKPTTKKCMYCEWETEDLENKSGQYRLHIEKCHGKTVKEYLNEFPKEIEYFKVEKRKLDREKLLSNKNNYVECVICGERMSKLTHSHLKKHNLTPSEYKLKYNSETNSNNVLKNLQLSGIKANENMKPTWESKPEKELKSLLLNWGIGFQSNNRKLCKGKEIDLIIDNKKLGIEYNGNLYHSEFYGGKDRHYHLNKTNMMNISGYSLIHIFEDEWMNKKDIVINKLKYLCGVSGGIRIGARKCKIHEISLEEKNTFLNVYHIQGEDSSTVKIGSYYDDVLVGVMTFKIKSKDSTEYELTRFATNYNYVISGLGSKMLKYFIKKYNPSKVISFADRRWTLKSDDNLYTKMGFKLVKTLKPEYKYYNKKSHYHERHHKFGFRKERLLKKYPDRGLNKDMTELEMALHLGFDRIWDCGLFKYELSLAQ